MNTTTIESASLETVAATTAANEVPASTQVESQSAKPAKAKAQSFRFLGTKIDVALFDQRVNEARSAAGRLVKKAEALGLGKAYKEADGGAKTVINIAVLNQLQKLGKVDADKAKSAAILNQIKALNSIADGLEALGFFKRETR